MSRVLVTGASGLLGFHYAWLAAQQHEVIGITHSQKLSKTPFQSIQLDLSQPGEGSRVITKYLPDVIVNCAALANIDACDREPEMAKRLNSDLPGELAQTASAQGVKMIHISTDAVFDGKKGDYSEEDEPNPLSTYARTKLDGELAVRKFYPSAIIARVNFFGWSMSGKHSLAEWFFNNLSAQKIINGFTDIFYCPLEVKQLCGLLFEMLQMGLHGIYHVLSQEQISKYDFGVKLAEQFHLDGKLINPVSWKDGDLVAARSPLLTLKTNKLQDALGKSLPGIQDGISRFHQDYLAQWPQKVRNYLASPVN